MTTVNSIAPNMPKSPFFLRLIRHRFAGHVKKHFYM